MGEGADSPPFLRCRSDIYANFTNLLARLAEVVGGDGLHIFVCVDGFIVLAGSVLTACVGGKAEPSLQRPSHAPSALLLPPPAPSSFFPPAQLRGRRGPRAAPRA